MSDNKDRETIVNLSWWILEQKLMYYNPDYGKCVSDEIYDAKEEEYKKACKNLGVEPTASNHVGFPWETPSGKLVVSKFRINDSRASNPKDVSISENSTRSRNRVRKRPDSDDSISLTKPRIRIRSKAKETSEPVKVRIRPRKRSP